MLKMAWEFNGIRQYSMKTSGIAGIQIPEFGRFSPVTATLAENSTKFDLKIQIRRVWVFTHRRIHEPCAEVPNSMLFKITLRSKKHAEASRLLLITTSWSNLLFPACQSWDPCGSSPLLIRPRAREKRLVVEATLSLRGSKLRRGNWLKF
jgi:hypothetical protein